MKQSIRILIVDDQSTIRETIRTLLGNNAEFKIAGQCRNGTEAVEKIRKQDLDLVFLDVQMPDFGGFKVIEKIGVNQMPATILISADDRNALQAFSVEAIDYLLKPFDKELFNHALERAKTYLRRRRLDETSWQMFGFLENLYGIKLPADRFEKSMPTKPEYSVRLVIKTGERIFLQNVDEIHWIEAEGDYMRLHLKSKSHLLRETMNALATKLNPQKFIRVHRSIIVNIEQVKDFHPLFNGEYIIALKDGKKLKTSRGYYSSIQELLS